MLNQFTEKKLTGLQVGYRQYVERPANGPDWGLRFTVTFLFPEK